MQSRHSILVAVAFAVLGYVFGAAAHPPEIAIAFQNEGTTDIDVLAGVLEVNAIWSPADIVPVGTVTHDYYATGQSITWFDAVSFEFDVDGLDVEHLILRAFLQKGSYPLESWEHYQILPGVFNPTNEDEGGENENPPEGDGILDHLPGGELPPGTTVGWVEFPFDATSDPLFIRPNGNVGVTLRLWNWRVDAVELLSSGCLREPAWQCDGDVDGDGQVNPVDSGLVQAAYGSVDRHDRCQYDLDCDGAIDPTDAGIVQSLFGTCEKPRTVCP